MSSVAEIERAISTLSPEQFRELERWFDEERNRKWDGQIEEDSRTGKLREVYEQLRSRSAGEQNTPLDEFLDNEELS